MGIFKSQLFIDRYCLFLDLFFQEHREIQGTSSNVVSGFFFLISGILNWDVFLESSATSFTANWYLGKKKKLDLGKVEPIHWFCIIATHFMEL